MSSYGTSLPSASATRLCRMREPSLSRSSRKLTFLRETALYSFTGTFKSPKLIDPLQIALGIFLNQDLGGWQKSSLASVSQLSASSWIPEGHRHESCGPRAYGELVPSEVQHQPATLGNGTPLVAPASN